MEKFIRKELAVEQITSSLIPETRRPSNSTSSVIKLFRLQHVNFPFCLMLLLFRVILSVKMLLLCKNESLFDDSCYNKTKAFLELLLLSHVKDADSLSPSCPCNPIRFHKLCKGNLEAMVEINTFRNVSFLQLES